MRLCGYTCILGRITETLHVTDRGELLSLGHHPPLTNLDEYRDVDEAWNDRHWLNRCEERMPLPVIYKEGEE